MRNAVGVDVRSVWLYMSSEAPGWLSDGFGGRLAPSSGTFIWCHGRHAAAWWRLEGQGGRHEPFVWRRLPIWSSYAQRTRVEFLGL